MDINRQVVKDKCQTLYGWIHPDDELEDIIDEIKKVYHGNVDLWFSYQQELKKLGEWFE